MLKKSTRVFTMAIVMATVISTATTSFAAPAADRSQMRGSLPANGQPRREDNLAIGDNRRNNPMESLLDSGAINQATYDAIQAYMEANRPTQAVPEDRADISERIENRKDILSEMLSAGVITQAEYDAIKTAMPSMTARFSIMDTFLEKEIIDQATYDAIQAYMEANKPDGTKIRAEIKAQFESGERPERPEVKDILTDLLDNGVITQAQYDAMKASMPERIK